MSEVLTRVRRAWPVLTLLALAVIFTFMLFFSRKAPVIASLDPAMAAPGETVVVSGDYFGRTPREGSLSIAGEIPPPSLIRSWSDQKIVFDIPEDAASGLVTVANTQGTSQGVLFTNTESIPTVLQTAADPGIPLIANVYPSHPVSGQIVTVNGRGFGSGSDTVVLRVETTGGPVLNIHPADSLSWTEGSVSFVLPAGAGGDSYLRFSAPRGDSAPYALQAVSPLSFSDPVTMTVEFHAHVTSSRPVVVWGPVPRVLDTKWSADAPTTAMWDAGTHDLRYRLTLTTWSQTAASLSGSPAPAPDTGASPPNVWKPATSSLKTLTASWGLDTGDAWQRVQKIQTGLSGFHREAGAHEPAGLSSDPAVLLASRSLNSFETSSLAVFLSTQAGLTMRLVSGLWLADDNSLRSRTWTEVWLPGGWIPWDPVDGTPGRLDNRHFAFETSPNSPERRLPRSSTWGRSVPATLGDATGEVTSPLSVYDTEPVVGWEFTRVEK
jgi:hypothetical protein